MEDTLTYNLLPDGSVRFLLGSMAKRAFAGAPFAENAIALAYPITAENLDRYFAFDRGEGGAHRTIYVAGAIKEERFDATAIEMCESMRAHVLHAFEARNTTLMVSVSRAHARGIDPHPIVELIAQRPSMHVTFFGDTDEEIAIELDELTRASWPLTVRCELERLAAISGTARWLTDAEPVVEWVDRMTSDDQLADVIAALRPRFGCPDLSGPQRVALAVLVRSIVEAILGDIADRSAPACAPKPACLLFPKKYERRERFRPTHRIRFTIATGTWGEVDVALQPNGAAINEREWRTGAERCAFWCQDGRWQCDPALGADVVKITML